MDRSYYKIADICNSNKIEISLVKQLHENNLIKIVILDTHEFIHEDELIYLEKYANWYYELELNIQGIEIVKNLVDQIKYLQDEIKNIRNSS